MTTTTSCNPQEVTWAVALKAPEGKKCLFYDPASPGWQVDDHHNIDDWLRQHLCTQTWPSHLIYNDEPTLSKPSSSLAHAKGVLAWDDKTIGWLIHSVPKFPATFLEENGQQTIAAIPQAETEYGQSFIYLTMPVARLPDVIGQLQLSDVYMYGIEDPAGVWSRKKKAPAKKDALKTIKLSDTITHVSKHKAWQQSIYDDYLAPTFGKLIQESWLRPGYDVTDDVLSAEELAWPRGDVKWNERQDHSKWAVSRDDNNPWAAVLDLNRMTSQKHRGGGGVVIQDAELSKAFKSLVKSTEWVKKDEHGKPI